MRIVRAEETIPHKGVIRLHHITDLHVGAPDFDEAAFIKRRDLIEIDPDARWTMGGDGGDLIRHNDPRYEVSSLHKRYREATDVGYATREHLVELFSPIVDKCWAWADGNHENKLNKFYGGNFGVEVCCDLGIESKFVGYRGFLALKAIVGTRKAVMPLLLDIQHGWQTGRLKGGFLVQAERELGMTEADVVLRGHNHQPAAHSFITIGVTGGGRGKIIQRMRTVVNGGCWRTGYRDDLKDIDRNKLSEVEGDLWSETKGFRTERVGGPVISLMFEQGSGEKGRSFRSAVINHTIIEGEIDERTLGL
jgi:hypothetical protein